MNELYSGSDWTKWDLHIHTPLSIEQNYGGDTPEVWEKFISDLEALDPSYSTLGINDYFTISGYKKLVEYQKNENRLQGRVLFPVIELRIKAFGNLNADDPWSRVNLHVIFNNIDIDKIESQFLNLLPFEYNGFNRTGLTEENLIDFGQFNINREQQAKKTSSLSPRKVGFKNLNFNHQSICNILKKSGLDYFIAIGKSEWEKLRWDGSVADKLEIIDICHFIFTSSSNDTSYQNAKNKLIKQNITKPLLDCSDAHDFSDSLDSNNEPIKDRIGNSLLWIKADLTFEGLKQTYYEPSTRFQISANKPISPVRKIKSVKLNFPVNTKIAKREGRTRGRENDFCLRGDNELTFSPYFTCLIGGRGTGKSTILNLIALKSGNNPLFFEQNVLVSGETLLDIKKCITIDTSSTEIEFISQNEIESFATTNELTGAIYDRLVQMIDYDGFKHSEEAINSCISKIEDQINNIKLIQSQRNDLTKLRNSFSDFTRIVSSYDSPEYKFLTEDIKSILKEIQTIDSSKKVYEDIVYKLEKITNTSLNESQENHYSTEIRRIISGLTSLLDISPDFSASESSVNSLNASLIQNKQKLDSYLTQKGVSADDINEYDRAVTQLPIINLKIETLTKSGTETKNKIDDFEAYKNDIIEARMEFERKINLALEPLNSQLISADPNILDIKFEYHFNYDSALNSLLDEFEIHFKDYKPSEHATKIDSVREYLLCQDPLQVDDYDEYMIALDKKGQSPKSKLLIQSLFEKKDNFEIYKLIIKKIYNDSITHKKIIGYYGGKELEECSFGQRCTAVIVALLMFGNKPLLIDEPEAHLDSKLIAEYLVNLIKKTKYRRQVIFATHNANFVVNGDAELIQILEVLDGNKTSITSTSIENLTYREKLLFLEGGRNAFEIRDKKLFSRQ